MEEQEKNSIEVLEELGTGMFCNIELPLTNSMISNVTAIYLGKDKDGRYNFFDGGGACGTFKMTKNFIIQREIKITNKLDEDKTYDLYVELKKYQSKIKDKHKDRDSR